ncbi:MAG: permease, partial [Verrucomicrobiae bacterium]|nr:permease [Verrucomicrobiae bacterium]
GSLVTAIAAGSLLPGCAMTTMPIAASLRERGARLGTLTCFIMIAPILSPHTVILTLGMLGWKFTLGRILLPVIMTFFVGWILNTLETRGWKHFQFPGFKTSPKPAHKSCCSHPEAAPEEEAGTDHCHREGADSNVPFWKSVLNIFVQLSPYLLIGLLLVSVFQNFVTQSWIEAHLRGGLGAYVLAALIGIPLYVCEGSEVPMTYALMEAGVGPGPAFTFLLGAVGTCIPTTAMAFRIIGWAPTLIYLAAWLVLTVGGGMLISLWY